MFHVFPIDKTPGFAGIYFDASSRNLKIPVGGASWNRNKREAKSYTEIFLTVGVDHPSCITFATDVLAEAVAAKEAGVIPYFIQYQNLTKNSRLTLRKMEGSVYKIYTQSLRDFPSPKMIQK